MKLKTLFRSASISDAIDEKTRTVELSFSSEEPYERFFGYEILDHSEGSINFSRLRSGAPFLLDHDPEKQIGVVESAIVDGKRGKATVRLSKSALGEEIFQDIKDKIRTSISVGYTVDEMEMTEKGKNGNPDTYVVKKWSPLEISQVSIPADFSVGIGRSDKFDKEYDVEVKTLDEGKKMPDENITSQVENKPAVDVKAVESNARKAELDRIRSITQMGSKFSNSDLASKFIDEGKSVDDFRAALLENMGESKPVIKKTDDSANIGMSEKDLKRFSFIKAMNFIANPDDRKAREAAAFEIECSEAAQVQTKKQAQGVMIPQDVLFKRDLTVGTDTAGGYTVDTDLMTGSFIELLRNRMMINRMGATMLNGLVGDLAIPKQTGGATAYWVAENGTVTESQQTIGQVALRPKTVGALTEYSRKLLIQSSLDVEAFVRRDLATVIALELDRVAIEGSGVDGQPIGLLNTTGIGSVVGGTNGAAPDWADIVDLETEVAIDNADIGSLGYLTNSAVRGKLKKTEKAATTNGQFIWGDTRMTDGIGELNGYRAAISNQVPSDLDKGTSTGVCSAILFGNWSDLIIGSWSSLDLIRDPYTNSATGAVRIVVMQDVDIAVRHAESFAAMQDALTA